MIDPHDYELTDEEHEALVLISEHAVVSPLSPAAQAVLNAYRDADINDAVTAAAVLRAVVNQMVPTDELYARSCCEFTADSIRNALLAIADELEQLGD
jgi:hypothetical protein